MATPPSGGPDRRPPLLTGGPQVRGGSSPRGPIGLGAHRSGGANVTNAQLQVLVGVRHSGLVTPLRHGRIAHAEVALGSKVRNTLAPPKADPP